MCHCSLGQVLVNNASVRSSVQHAFISGIVFLCQVYILCALNSSHTLAQVRIPHRVYSMDLREASGYVFLVSSQVILGMHTLMTTDLGEEITKGFHPVGPQGM